MFTLLSSLLVIDMTSSVCPDSNLLKPCSCNNDEIDCNKMTENIDLVQMFQTLSKRLPKDEKHFNEFLLNNTLNTELKENTFSDITFNIISINNCLKLKTIDKNAFNTTDMVTIKVVFRPNPLLISTDNSIFEILNKFVNVDYIEVEDINITEIPSNAFRNIISFHIQFNIWFI